MTDREKMMIEAYIPSPPDETLGFDEFYVRDTAGRVRRVRVVEILPHNHSMTYGLVEISTGRRIDAGNGSEFVGFTRGQMYDNRNDCRDNTHDWVDDWERLRALQQGTKARS